MCIFFFQAEDGIRDLVRSRGLGDVYKRQGMLTKLKTVSTLPGEVKENSTAEVKVHPSGKFVFCLLYTSDAADERSSVDLGGRRIIKKT